MDIRSGNPVQYGGPYFGKCSRVKNVQRPYHYITSDPIDRFYVFVVFDKNKFLIFIKCSFFVNRMFKNLVIRFQSLPKCCHIIMLLCYDSIFDEKTRFWIFQTQKTRKLKCYRDRKIDIFMKTKKMASSCLFDLSSNVILIFLEHLCHLNITW